MQVLHYFIILLFSLGFVALESKLFLKPHKVVCDCSMSYNLSKCACSLQVYNVTTSLLTLNYKINKKVTHMKVKASVFFKFFSDYRKLDFMSFEFPDICDFIAGNFQGAVEKYYHDSYSEWFGQWLQTCPYHVSIINVDKLPISAHIEPPTLFSFAAGDYILSLQIYDEENTHTMSFKIYFTLKPSQF